jgi:hypothetical protein
MGPILGKRKSREWNNVRPEGPAGRGRKGGLGWGASDRGYFLSRPPRGASSRCRECAGPRAPCSEQGYDSAAARSKRM